MGRFACVSTGPCSVIAIALVMLLSGLLLPKVEGSGRLSLTMINYTNPGGTGVNGNCCDGYFSGGALCGDGCDHYFIVCMGGPTSGDTTEVHDCDLMKFETDETDDVNSIVFGSIIPETTANPQTATFTSWPGSFRMKVDIWDEDDSWVDSDDLVENIIKNFTVPASMSGQPTRVHYLNVSARTRLYMSLVVTCDSGFYGPSCTIPCNPNDDDTNGHYDCDDMGNKICHPGWTLSSCTEDVDECGNQPCLNNGSCSDQINGFTCNCPDGFEGELCEMAPVHTTEIPYIAARAGPTNRSNADDTTVAVEVTTITANRPNADDTTVAVEVTTITANRPNADDTTVAVEGTTITANRPNADDTTVAEEMYNHAENITDTTTVIFEHSISYTPVVQSSISTLTDVQESSPESSISPQVDETSPHMTDEEVSTEVYSTYPTARDGKWTQVNDEVSESVRPSSDQSSTATFPISSSSRQLVSSESSSMPQSTIPSETTSISNNTTLTGELPTVKKPSPNPIDEISIPCKESEGEPSLTFSHPLDDKEQQDVERNLLKLLDKNEAGHKLRTNWFDCETKRMNITTVYLHLTDKENKTLSWDETQYILNMTNLEEILHHKLHLGAEICNNPEAMIKVSQSMDGGDGQSRQMPHYWIAILLIAIAMVALIIAIAFLAYHKRKQRTYEVQSTLFPSVKATPTQAVNPTYEDYLLPGHDVINIAPLCECENDSYEKLQPSNNV